MDMLNDLKDKAFWEAILIRVIKTWCQAFGAVVGIDGAGRTFADIDWIYALNVATVAAIICLAWNIATGLPEVKFRNYLEQLKELRPEPKVEELEDDEDEEGDE